MRRLIGRGIGRDTRAAAWRGCDAMHVDRLAHVHPSARLAPGVVVLVPRYGIEGIVYVCKAGERSAFEYDQKKDVLRAPGCTLKTFDKVTVQISVDSSRPHRPKLDLAIVEPKLPKA